ncbi:serine hydrolase domain-containing protein [Colwellia piezophila]|uniref:serine hydrolase domain-containing protein n=1 Tax=Colwellia piezophila TaxID=211668 RepID=UPI00036D6781|nr:serine hydrolase domain-containing protein [Colwellia piezophila]
MNILNIGCVLSLLFISGCGSSGTEDKQTIPQIKSTLTETLDNYLETTIPDSGAGIAIFVHKNDTVQYRGFKGLANKLTNTSIDADTGFRIASISKVFTALAIMKLYEQEQIQLNDSILIYLPELPSSWQHITIHHLLSHQSGIPQYEVHPDAAIWADGQTNDDVLNFYVSHPELSFEPGSTGEYSNSGYHLLAEIIFRATGIYYEDYMDEYFFKPLIMTNSYVTDETTSPKANDALNFAQYTRFNGKNNFTNGANGIVSSINDLNLFISSLLNDQIVKPETLELMLKHHTSSLLGEADYGYGWILAPEGSDAFSHTGGHDGFRTWLLINRDKNLRLIILGNGGDLTGDHGHLANLMQPFL